MPPDDRKRSAPAAAPRGRGRPAARDGADTRAAILAAAQRRFGEAGYHGVSVEAIAADCEVNVRALYYHFASKQVLFDAARDDAFARFGHEVLARVFVHDGLRDRVAGYVDVYRSLHRSDPHLLPFVGMSLVDTLGTPGTPPPGEAMASGAELERFLGVLVDDAIERGEVNPALDRDGALLLLVAMGMGLALASLGDPASFPAMLDALDLLNTGDLFAPGP